MPSPFEYSSTANDEEYEIVFCINSEITLTETIPAERAIRDDTSDTNTEKESFLFSRLIEDNLGIDPALLNRAKNGAEKEINYIGALYHHRQEYQTAMEWLQLAAEKKFPPALYMIGSMYKEGQGVDIDLLAAMSWFLKAAKFGHLDACTKIAEMFGEGLGVPEDGEKALSWYRVGEVPTRTSVETIEDDYITVIRNDEAVLKLIIEAREILENEMEKRWKDKENKLDEQISSLLNYVDDFVNNTPSPTQYRW